MKELLIDNGTRHIDSFKPFLSPNADLISRSGINLQAIDLYNAVILSGSGSHAVLRHADLYKDEVELIKRSTTPILGICVGFELMVHAFGGTLKKMTKKIQAVHEVRFTADPLFEGISDLVVYKGHRWVVETLPDGLIPLAYSSTGIEVVKHKERLMYGVQFHPEARMDTTNGYKILQNFLNMAEALNTQR